MEDNARLQNLSKIQKEIVECTNGPVLVLAGAGSGKTRVLTNRIAHLVLDLLVPGYSILAITFTNKATKEMKERLDIMLGEDNGVWVYTFHKFCSILLRKHAEKAGFSTNFTIFDESDSKKVLNRIFAREGIDYIDKDDMKSIISEAKQKGLTSEKYASTTEESAEISKIFQQYQDYLKECNALDYDDLLVYAKKLLEDFPEVAEYYQNKFRYIHVDEFQDTNKIQNDIVKILADKWKNLFVVGDDDQCIYGWRGSEIKNILCFDEEYPEAKIFKLEENYRSTNDILLVANNLIKNNKGRHSKELIALKGKGVRVEYINAFNDYDEANKVAMAIKNLKYISGYQNSDFAILVREAKTANLIESRIREEGYNYRVLGGTKFYDRKEIQDIVAYLRILTNEKDNEAFSRIINYPSRNIGEVMQASIAEYAQINKLSLVNATIEMAKSLKESKKNEGIKDFAAIITKLKSMSFKNISGIISTLVEEIKIKEFLEKSPKKLEAESRYENILFLIEHAKEQEKKHSDMDLVEFVQSVTLVPDEKEIDMEGVITISTVHAVKGLEFPIVFIPACEEGVFPTRQALDAGEKEIEEERRVMYVAITRAKERLYISNAYRRFRYGKEEVNFPSRFIAEMKGTPDGIVRKNYLEDKDEHFYGYSDDDYGYNGSKEKVESSVSAIKKCLLTQEKVFNDDLDSFVKGAQINHKRYGDGLIILISGEGDEKVATIEFKDLGIKKFVIKNAPLTLK